MITSRWGTPIEVHEAREAEQRALLDLLGSLTAAQWSAPTACTGWTVHDLVTHLLGVQLSTLSRHRDGHRPDSPAAGETLPAFIDRINAEWVGAVRRVSPRVLATLLADTSREVGDYWRSVRPHAEGEPVTWAGREPAPRWLDAAREYTEYWVHQQQIRAATGARPLDEPSLRDPVVDTFMRALPVALEGIGAPEGTMAGYRITGLDREWTVVREDAGWRFAEHGDAVGLAAVVCTDPDTFWRLATRNATVDSLRDKVDVEGDPDLCTAMLGMVSIIVSGTA
ncbi:hypothetical protein CFN78_22770 [Amycolatopsis antarctica]|uniref:Mycothiol-dependent maleylpyruvate isomerase metal-binding domain-containing protein n=1 Tax=Amycolatopsis antarctica TaxID=1854586 RepID=A0A263D0A8_9PSEU|nr:maleylpyruvate isomerase family mycothiol-dependent enzyme [Amycolatopsis antarctica]OZM70976.1 hypothetical protein CFN78_22770 [Amycolatopsis antarctica]